MELKTVIAETRTRAGEAGTLASPAVKQLLQELRQTDNRTNWFYLGRAWLYLALVAGLASHFSAGIPTAGGGICRWGSWPYS